MFHDDKTVGAGYTLSPKPREEQFNGFYETGNTRPEKPRRLVAAAALLAAIFFGGLTGGAVLMNLNPAVPQETEDVPNRPTPPHRPQRGLGIHRAERRSWSNGAQDDGTELLISETPEAVGQPAQSGEASLRRSISPVPQWYPSRLPGGRKLLRLGIVMSPIPAISSQLPRGGRRPTISPSPYPMSACTTRNW